MTLETRIYQAPVETARSDADLRLNLNQVAVESARADAGLRLQLSSVNVEATRADAAVRLYLSAECVEVLIGRALPEVWCGYPKGLPCPIRWDVASRERRGVTTLAPGKVRHRSRWRDRMVDIEAAWFYTSAMLAIWTPWYEDELDDGQRWFEARLPGYGGWVSRVVRYKPETLRIDRVSGTRPGAGAAWIVSATIEQRGRSLMPACPEQ